MLTDPLPNLCREYFQHIHLTLDILHYKEYLMESDINSVFIGIDK